MMASVLTEHVRHFGPDSDPHNAVLPALERILRNRMRQKNLLIAPPGVLGYSGVSKWSAIGAFEDIVADCYMFAILDRIQGLQNQLRIKPNIDGLISRNVGNFLLERQKKHNPVGYAVYGNAKAAILEASAKGALVIDNSENGKISNESVVRFSQSSPGAPPVSPEVVQNAARTSAVLTEGVRHLSSTSEEGRSCVLRFVEQLRENGVAAVRCGDLIAVLANIAREIPPAVPASDAAWGGDEVGVLVRMVRPDASPEEREHWEYLKRVIPRKIGEINRQQRVRDRLVQVPARPFLNRRTC
ncbi:hypothetical protein, partial [Zavarzinella formosa]|uniref:hypothetical protein n=1 Tax=Zavarzinella formosa TaxID=360055 RepID=UPI00138AB40D